MDLGVLSDEELFAHWAQVMRALRVRGLVRSSNNPIADYAERLVATRLNLSLAGRSAAGYDAVDGDGVRYQIKARRVTPENSSRQMSALRSLDADPFDYLIAVLFTESLQLVGMWRMSLETVRRHSTYVPHTNSHRLVLGPRVLMDPAVEQLP